MTSVLAVMDKLKHSRLSEGIMWLHYWKTSFWLNRINICITMWKTEITQMSYPEERIYDEGMGFRHFW